MLAITRINQIRELVKQNRSVVVSKLADQFAVTEETIRRDLKKLEEEGVLVRVYGGAYSIEGVQNDVDYLLRETILVPEKKRIADRCLPLVNNGDSIYIDCSTTALQLAMSLTSHHLTVVTNSLRVAQVFSDSNDIHLVLIGGSLHNRSMSFLGQNASQALANYFVDKAFVSCRSLSMENGLTDSNEDRATIRRIAIERSSKTYLLLDNTKFGSTSFAHIADISSIDTLITDEKVSDEWRIFLASKNVTLIEG